MAVSPILPVNFSDPTGTVGLVRSANREFDRRMKLIRNRYVEQMDRIPYETITVNATRYAFELDQWLLSDILSNVDRYIDEILLESPQQNWFFDGYVSTAYQRGTAKVFANLAAQSPVYKAGQVSLQSLLRSEPYINRVALQRARIFEDMKGLSGAVKSNMSRILAEGIGRGLNPRDIAKNLTERAGIEARRGHLIAQTEIPGALRRARLDEADYAAEQYGIVSKIMHLSAFMATTRPDHAALNGVLRTTAQVREWYSLAKNACNCHCAGVEVMVDGNGKPLVPSIVERAKKNQAVAEARYDAEHK